LDDSEKNLEDKSLFGKLVQLQLRQIWMFIYVCKHAIRNLLLIYY
jgi:hypothetical protein